MNIIKEFSDMYLIKTDLQRHKLGCVTITFQAFDRKCAGGCFFWSFISPWSFVRVAIGLRLSSR